MNGQSRLAIKPGDLIAVGVLSSATLVYELTLTRLFSLAQFYHFAFMAISLALLGSGCAGSLLSVWPRLGRRTDLWAGGFGILALASYAILNWVPFDSFAIAWDSRQIVYLILTFTGAALPFLGSGMVIGELLSANRDHLHRVYAANLGGSAVGCVLVLPLLDWIGGEGTLFAAAALGLIAAALFGLPDEKHTTIRKTGALIAASLLILIALLRPESLAMRLSPYKGLTQALRAPDAAHTRSEWNAYARVDVVESESIHIMPGLSQNAMITSPPLQSGLTLDGDNLQPITDLEPADELARQLADNLPQAVIDVLKPGADRTLVLEPGGGWDVLMLLANGTPALTAVEHNPLVIDVLRDFPPYLYADPRIKVIAQEGRTFVKQTDDTYDVIDIALSDSYHPVTSGAYSLSEDYRYTVEAICEVYARLDDGGLLIITRWLQTPPTESLRVLATVKAALRSQGIDQLGDHIAAFRTMRTMTFVVGQAPLTGDQSDLIRAFCADRGYDVVWLPDIRADEVNQYNRLPEPVYYETFSAMLADPTGLIDQYEYDIRPPTDNRPFFFHTFRWRQTPEIVASLGATWQPFGGSGYLVLIALLLMVSVLAVVLIAGPLLIRRGESRLSTIPPAIKWRGLLYFTMLGLGFLFVEMPLAQRFILFVGQPVIALAVVLFAILLFSGLGSLTAPRWNLRIALPALVIAVLLMPPILAALFDLALGWPLAARIGLSILALSPVGVLMGIPFSRGLVLIEQQAPGFTPWAWAVNGCASVISAVVSVMIAVSWGFSAVLIVGAAMYAAALVSIWPFGVQQTSKKLP
ncbi:MAG: hypothetical protein JXJ17_03800 [Anaerolineae bacterium]|nr:hypothetical protein [Anaerolineae bacterium]